MNLKVLKLASTVILFSSTPILAQQREQPTEGSKSLPQQSKVVPAQSPLEIKGDRIGETFAQFTAHYPNAKCEDETAEVRVCTQAQGISLAGLTTMSDTCNPPTTPYWHDVCGMEGLLAKFSRNKLTVLSFRFWVNGAVNEIEMSTWTTCDAFTQKYGKPDFGDGQHGCSWVIKNKEGVIEQSLLVSTDRPKIGGEDAVFTSVMLAYPSPSKDI